MDEELKSILREAFGDSSSDTDCEPSDDHIDDSGTEISKNTRIWEPVVGINGLWICRDFLTLNQQSSLLSDLEKEGYFAGGLHNQAMRFGNLPSWATELSHCIRENAPVDCHICHITESPNHSASEESCLLPEELLWREPLFNQLIVNIYQPGEGICAHVDLMRFQDGIAIISLESSCVMHFSPVEIGPDHHKKEGLNEGHDAKIPVLLTPGSLIFMWGEARYHWKHEINRIPGFQIWEAFLRAQIRKGLSALCPSVIIADRSASHQWFIAKRPFLSRLGHAAKENANKGRQQVGLYVSANQKMPTTGRELGHQRLESKR